MFEVIDEFKKQFIVEYKSLLNSKSFDLLVKSVQQNGIVGLSNIIMFGPDELVLDLCIKIILNTTCHCTNTCMIKKDPDPVHVFPHYWNPHYLLIDAEAFLSEDRRHFIDHVRKMVSYDCLDSLTKRHIMVVKNAHAMTPNMFLAMRKMIEDDKQTCLFLFVTTKYSKLDNTIVSRCMSIRCCIKPTTIKDSVTASILLKSAERKSMMETFVTERLNKMKTLYLNHHHVQLVNTIEDTAMRIETSGVRPEKIYNLIIRVCSLIQCTNMHDIIHLLAMSQVKICQSNKLAFVLEGMLYELITFLIL